MSVENVIVCCQIRDVEIACKVLEAWEACEIEERLPDRLIVRREGDWMAAFTAERDDYYVRWQWRDFDGPLGDASLEFIGHQLCALMSARGGNPREDS